MGPGVVDAATQISTLISSSTKEMPGLKIRQTVKVWHGITNRMPNSLATSMWPCDDSEECQPTFSSIGPPAIEANVKYGQTAAAYKMRIASMTAWDTDSDSDSEWHRERSNRFG